MSPDRTGFGAINPDIGLNKINGPHNMPSTRMEKVNPIKHLSSFGIGSPIGFRK